jgi:hypothetical protein
MVAHRPVVPPVAHQEAPLGRREAGLLAQVDPLA